MNETRADALSPVPGAAPAPARSLAAVLVLLAFGPWGGRALAGRRGDRVWRRRVDGRVAGHGALRRPRPRPPPRSRAIPSIATATGRSKAATGWRACRRPGGPAPTCAASRRRSRSASRRRCSCDRHGDWAGEAWWLASAAGLLIAHVGWTVAGAAAAGRLRRPASVAPAALAARLDALVRRCRDHGSPSASGAAATTPPAPTPRSPASAGRARSSCRTRSSTPSATTRSRSSSRTSSRTTSTATCGAPPRGGPCRCRSSSARRCRRARSRWARGSDRRSAPPRRCRGCRCSARCGLTAHRALEPVGLALSRRRELAADAYAIRLTGGADAFVSSMRRLSRTNLVDDRPPRLARLFATHPPVRDRVVSALRQAERLPQA